MTEKEKLIKALKEKMIKQVEDLLDMKEFEDFCNKRPPLLMDILENGIEDGPWTTIITESKEDG